MDETKCIKGPRFWHITYSDSKRGEVIHTCGSLDAGIKKVLEYPTFIAFLFVEYSDGYERLLEELKV